MKNDSANPKVVLITGGAARIGASIAKHLHKIGFNIVLHYNHSKTAAETLCAELNSCRNNSAYCFEAELLDIADIERLFINTLAVWGKLDILINNASNFYPTPLTNINEWQWDELLGVNAKAPVFLSKVCSPALRESNGCIINISDVAVTQGRKEFLIYSLAKAALNNLTRSLARELAPEIRVNAIAPGAILPPNFSDSDTELVSNDIDPLSISCLNYCGKAEDISYAVTFLINNTYTNGQVLNVDGGRHLKFLIS